MPKSRENIFHQKGVVLFGTHILVNSFDRIAHWRKERVNIMVSAVIMAGVLGTLWAWIVWIVIGGIAGAIADRIVQGDRLGILGNIILGIVGGLLGGVILGLFDLGGQGIIWTFVTALIGAIILLLIAKAVMGGIGGPARRP